MTDAELFHKNGCVRIENFFDPQIIFVVSNYLENKIKCGEWKNNYDNEPDKTSAYAYYADPLIEVLLLEAKKSVEIAVNKELLPTYSFVRIYQPGESLPAHIDRPSCEVTVTVNVANKGGISPIYTKYKDADPEKHLLNPGDAVVYKGCEATHWRKPLETNQLNVQFMLHYVDKNGPNAGYAKDNRPAYGMHKSSRRS